VILTIALIMLHYVIKLRVFLYLIKLEVPALISVCVCNVKV